MDKATDQKLAGLRLNDSHLPDVELSLKELNQALIFHYVMILARDTP